MSDLSTPDFNPLLDQPKKEKGISLSNDQRILILRRWDDTSNGYPSIPELIKLAFPNIEKPDGRSLEGIAIKSLLVEHGLSAQTSVEAKKERNNVELTDAQKEYILNNCSSMKPFEMAKVLFNNNQLSPGSMENRAVTNHVKTLDPRIVYGDEIPEPNYRAPKTLASALNRIKKYVSATEDWDIKKLTPIQKKCCESLIHYLHDLRFKRQIDNYEKTEDKITMESEFIKYVYNKTDLEQEDISQYVSLCSYVVTEFNIKSNIEMLQAAVENDYDENHKVSEALVKALESARQDLNNCTLRQGKLYEGLTEKRSDKLSKELKDKESLLNLFNTWKNFDSRQQLLRIRQRDKENLKKQIHEIEEMDELKQRVLGLDVDSIING